jgi:hypothetical protein
LVVHPQSVVVFSADVVSAGATGRFAVRGLSAGQLFIRLVKKCNCNISDRDSAAELSRKRLDLFISGTQGFGHHGNRSVCKALTSACTRGRIHNVAV